MVKTSTSGISIVLSMIRRSSVQTLIGWNLGYQVLLSKSYLNKTPQINVWIKLKLYIHIYPKEIGYKIRQYEAILQIVFRSVAKIELSCWCLWRCRNSICMKTMAVGAGMGCQVERQI